MSKTEANRFSNGAKPCLKRRQTVYQTEANRVSNMLAVVFFFSVYRDLRRKRKIIENRASASEASRNIEKIICREAIFNQFERRLWASLAKISINIAKNLRMS